MKLNNVFIALLVFIISTYLFISISEWSFHKYVMHQLGIIGENVKTMVYNDTGHIIHHKNMYLNQKIYDDSDLNGLIFNYINLETILITLFYGFFAIILWNYTFIKKSIPIYLILSLIVIIMTLYIWCWGSIHTSYHHIFIVANKKQPDGTVVISPLPFFKPNTSSSIYKYLYWYHTIHHLTKGDHKVNYNILFPFADFIFGTYKSNVDNTLYFANRTPVNAQEQWLKEHLVFEIRVLDNNVIE